MAESQSQKKNKKAKKKSESNSTASVAASSEARCSGNVSNNSSKNCQVSTLNIKTPESIEVTSVQNVHTQPTVDEGTNKKKKKSKKKSKEEPSETAAAVTVENNNTEIKSNPSFLNFSENGIHLVNHPEISVTFTDAPQSKVIEAENIKEKSPPTEDEKQNDNDSGNSSKKKKKKKRKGSNASDVQSSNVPPIPPASTSETTYVTPTYTKVVTSDNTCVLVVNNENLAAASKSFDSLEDKKSKVNENKVNFSITSEKPVGDVLFTKKISPDTNIKLGNGVSIFPVLTSLNENTEKTTILCQPNLEVVSSIVKKDISDIPEKENTEGSTLTKAELKAERRAKQEAQRAAKSAKSTAKPDSENVAQAKNVKSTKETYLLKNSSAATTESVVEKSSAKSSSVEKDTLRKVRLFSHLPECRKLDLSAKVHPAILEVGSQYSKGILCGSNARCIALLAALREIIKDYVPQPNKNICRELETNIQTYLSYLNNCRPLSVSMVNAVKFLKHQINHISSEMEVDKTRELLCKFIDDFVNEEILLAKEAIGNSASAKIVDGDVILVFAHSSLVKDVLCKAHNENKIFRVIVADSRPKLEGLEMLRCLVKQGLHCSYISINAVSYVMKEVSKVIIGAHALLSNGCVMSRLGSKQIALVASSYSVPVLVCCETYKFCERVLTDSFVHNELGEPEDITATTLISNESLKNWNDMSSLQLLNLLYDVTPPDLISMVVTEKGVLPCTSVPVVLRVRYAGLHE